jgi:hypothetical protein
MIGSGILLKHDDGSTPIDMDCSTKVVVLKTHDCTPSTRTIGTCDNFGADIVAPMENIKFVTYSSISLINQTFHFCVLIVLVLELEVGQCT